MKDYRQLMHDAESELIDALHCRTGHAAGACSEETGAARSARGRRGVERIVKPGQSQCFTASALSRQRPDPIDGNVTQAQGDVASKYIATLNCSRQFKYWPIAPPDIAKSFSLLLG